MPISFIKGKLTTISEELGGILSNTFNKNQKIKEYPLNEMVNMNSFVLASYFDVVQCSIWQPKAITSDLVAFISNMPDGWPTFIKKNLKNYDWEIIRVRLSDKDNKYPVYQIEYLSQSKSRIIQALKDSDKWKFYQ